MFWSRKRVGETQWNMNRRRINNIRATHIERTTDKYLNSVPKGCATMDRQVLVSYKDLIDMWNNANELKDSIE